MPVGPSPSIVGKDSPTPPVPWRRRAANNALHRIALVRMANHPSTRAYVARQTANGHSKREIIRMLKRAIAREIYRLLTHPADVPNYADLRAHSTRCIRSSSSTP